MKGIYIAALITTIAVLLIFGTLAYKIKDKANERWLLLAFLIALPLQPLAFYFVRLPLNRLLVMILGSKSTLYEWITLFYAPLTEEPAKLVPLLVPFILRDINKETFVRYAVVIGLGFGIGEIWFVASRVAQNPQFASMPFYNFGGFFSERMMVCVIHGVFLSVSLWRLRDRFWFGVLGAMGLHFLGNFPIYLMTKNFLGLGQPFWQVLVSLWVVLFFIGGLALLAAFKYGSAKKIGRFIFGKAKCPECGKVYDKPLFGLNLGPKRYEPCPHCKKWHLVGIENSVTEEQTD